MEASASAQEQSQAWTLFPFSSYLLTGSPCSSPATLGKMRLPEASPQLSKENCLLYHIRRDVASNSCCRFCSASPTSQKPEILLRDLQVPKALSADTTASTAAVTALPQHSSSPGVTVFHCAWLKGLGLGQDTGEGSSVSGQDNSCHNHWGLHASSPL